MNRESESSRQDLYMSIGAMKDSKTKAEESTPRVVYYESLNRELKTKPIKECRYDERLQTRVEESTHLTCPRLVTELEHLKIETRLIDEMFVSEMEEYVFLM